MKMPHADAGRFLMAQLDILETQKKRPECTTPPPVQKAFAVAAAAPPPTPGSAAPVESGASPSSSAANEASDPAPGDGSDGAAAAPGTSASEEPADVSDAMSKASLSDGETAPTPPPPRATVEHRSVPQTPTEAMRAAALDIYERARAADNPKGFPSPSTHWGVVEAPKICRGLHAAAVIIDCIKRFEGGAVPPDLLPFQTAAHRRSQQLSSQIHNAFKLASAPVRADWAPVDQSAPFAGFKPPVARPSPQPVAIAFPSAPTS